MAGPAFAQQATDTSEAGAAPATEAGAEALPAGILPIPEYGGDVWSRDYFSGD